MQSHCVNSYKGLLQQCKRGRDCSGLGGSTIFPEHPVVKIDKELCGLAEKFFYIGRAR